MFPIFSVTKISGFRNLWLGQVFSQIAVHILAFALIINVYEKTSSNTAVSLLVLTIGVPALLFGMIAGVFVDHWSKKNVLFWCNVIRALLVFLLVISRGNLVSIYFISVLISLTTQFFIPAEVPLIPQLVPKVLLLTANSVFTFTYYTTMSLGFILSGPLLSAFGETMTFLIIVLLFFLAAYFVNLVPRQKFKVLLSFNKVLKRVSDYLNEGLSFMKSRRDVTESIVIFTVAQAVVITLASLAPGFADKILMIELTQATVVVLGPAVVGVILASLLVGNIGPRLLKNTLVNIGIIGSGLVLLSLALFVRVGHSPSLVTLVERVVPGTIIIDRLEVVMVLFALFGGFNAFVLVPVNTFLQQATTESIRGRVYGILAALSGGISILPVIGVGQLADRVGVGKTMFILSLIIITFGIYRTARGGYNENV